MPEVRSQLKSLRAELLADQNTAQTAVRAAFTSKAAGKDIWPAFPSQFKVLEESMGKFGDTIQKSDESAKTDSARQGKTALMSDGALILVGGILLVFIGHEIHPPVLPRHLN